MFPIFCFTITSLIVGFGLYSIDLKLVWFCLWILWEGLYTLSLVTCVNRAHKKREEEVRDLNTERILEDYNGDMTLIAETIVKLEGWNA